MREYRAKVPNLTKRALQDIIEHTEALMQKLDKGLNSEQSAEAVMGIFAIRIGTIERIARMAMNGEYYHASRLPESQRVHHDRPGDEAEE